jgi:hypothetical protein
VVVVVGRVTCKYKKDQGQQQPRHRHCGADVPGARANTKKEEEQQQHVIVVLMSPEREPSPGKG